MPLKGASSSSKKANLKDKKKHTSGELFFLVMSGFCFVLILKNPDAAIEYMGRGLKLCATTVIPSLFPFMVISELVASSGVGESLGRIFAKPMKFIFGISGAGCSAVFLGSLCGFPIGAKTAVSLYDKNMISKNELEYLLTFSNNPSSAYLISAVGISLFADKRIGTMLYFTVLSSGLLVGFIFRFFLNVKCHTDMHKHYPMGLRRGSVELFTSSVSSAATAMITVCAYVIFFSSVTGIISGVIRSVGELPPFLNAALFGLLEISGGMAAAKEIPSLASAVIMSAFIAGWSGLCVHFQIMSLCTGRGISFKPFIAAKFFQGIFSAIAVGIILRIFPELLEGISAGALKETFFSLTDIITGIPLIGAFSALLFVVGCCIAFFKSKIVA